MDLNYNTPVREVPCAVAHPDNRPCGAVHRKSDGTGTITIGGTLEETGRLWSAITLLLEVGADFGESGKAGKVQAAHDAHRKALSGEATS